MFDDDDDFEEERPVGPLNKSTHRWLFVAAFLEVFVDVLMAFYKLFSVGRDAALQKYRFDNERQKFMTEAAQEIERLISGDFDATTFKTSGRVGSRPDESQD